MIPRRLRSRDDGDDADGGGSDGGRREAGLRRSSGERERDVTRESRDDLMMSEKRRENKGAEGRRAKERILHLIKRRKIQVKDDQKSTLELRAKDVQRLHVVSLSSASSVAVVAAVVANNVLRRMSESFLTSSRPFRRNPTSSDGESSSNRYPLFTPALLLVSRRLSVCFTRTSTAATPAPRLPSSVLAS